MKGSLKDQLERLMSMSCVCALGYLESCKRQHPGLSALNLHFYIIISRGDSSVLNKGQLFRILWENYPISHWIYYLETFWKPAKSAYRHYEVHVVNVKMLKRCFKTQQHAHTFFSMLKTWKQHHSVAWYRTELSKLLDGFPWTTIVTFDFDCNFGHLLLGAKYLHSSLDGHNIGHLINELTWSEHRMSPYTEKTETLILIKCIMSTNYT